MDDHIIRLAAAHQPFQVLVLMRTVLVKVGEAVNRKEQPPRVRKRVDNLLVKIMTTNWSSTPTTLTRSTDASWPQEKVTTDTTVVRTN